MKTGTEALSKVTTPPAGHFDAPEKKAPAKKTAVKKPAKKQGKSLAEIHTRVNADGTFTHRHTYEDANGIPDLKQPEYTSQTLDDLQDHMDQHLGGADPDAQGGDPTSAAPAADPEGDGGGQ